MKLNGITTAIIIAIAILHSVSASAYFPMIKKGYTWVYLDFSKDLYGNSSFYSTELKIGDDTIVDNTQYFKLNYFGKGYLLREDSIGEKVYIRRNYQIDSDHLLYDFTLLPGDSAIVFYLDIEIDHWPVDFAKELADTAKYGKIIIDSVEYVNDELGNKIKKIHFTKETDKLHIRPRHRYYYERYGSFNQDLINFMSGGGGFGDTNKILLCGLDENGNVGFHNKSMDKYLRGKCYADMDAWERFGGPDPNKPVIVSGSNHLVSLDFTNRYGKWFGWDGKKTVKVYSESDKKLVTSFIIDKGVERYDFKLEYGSYIIKIRSYKKRKTIHWEVCPSN